MLFGKPDMGFYIGFLATEFVWVESHKKKKKNSGNWPLEKKKEVWNMDYLL